MTALLNLILSDPTLIEHVKYQTDDLCLISVSTDGMTLKHVRFMTDEIIMAALQQNGLAIQFIPPSRRTEAFCRAAVAQTMAAAIYVPIPVFAIIFS
jgi:hypothetical protein